MIKNKRVLQKEKEDRENQWRKHKIAVHFKKEILEKEFISKERTVEVLSKGYLGYDEERFSFQ